LLVGIEEAQIFPVTEFDFVYSIYISSKMLFAENEVLLLATDLMLLNAETRALIYMQNNYRKLPPLAPTPFSTKVHFSLKVSDFAISSYIESPVSSDVTPPHRVWYSRAD